MRFPSLIPVACSAGLLALSPCARAKVLQSWTFDEPNPLHNLVIQGDKPEIVPDPKNPANKVMKAVLRPGAEREERSEVMPGVINFGEERWIGVRILRPAKFDRFTCSFQLGPMTDTSKEIVGLFQVVTYEKDAWVFRVYGGRGVPSKGPDPISPVRHGVWETWVFHVKLTADQNGVIEAWKNGSSVYRHHGMNAKPGDILRIKWGVYVGKGSGAKYEMVTLFDDVYIGDEASGMREVSPKSGGPGSGGTSSGPSIFKSPPASSIFQNNRTR